MSISKCLTCARSKVVFGLTVCEEHNVSCYVIMKTLEGEECHDYVRVVEYVEDN